MVFLFCWLVAPFILLSISAGKRPSYLLMLYPAAAAFLAQYIVLLAQQTSATALGKQTSCARWLAFIQAAVFSGGLLFVIVRLIQIHAPGVASAAILLAIVPLFFMWRSAARLRIFTFMANSMGMLFITYITYSSFVVAHEDETQSARLVMDRLASFSATGRPVALYRPNERISGAASFYLQRRLPTIDTMDELDEALADQPNTVVLIDGSNRLDFAKFKDEGDLKYGKDHYHFLSGKLPDARSTERRDYCS